MSYLINCCGKRIHQIFSSLRDDLLLSRRRTVQDFFFLIRKNQSNVKELGRSMNNGCRFMAARDIYINH
jgi:hypothetical protein